MSLFSQTNPVADLAKFTIQPALMEFGYQYYKKINTLVL